MCVYLFIHVNAMLRIDDVSAFAYAFAVCAAQPDSDNSVFLRAPPMPFGADGRCDDAIYVMACLHR